jgi:hypothetical protein
VRWLRFEAPRCAQQRHQGLAQQEGGLARHQALAARAPHRGIAARGTQSQRQGLFPGKPRPDRLRRRHVREPCGTLPYGAERERGGCCHRAPGRRKECGKGRGRISRTERIAQAHRGRPLGERGAGHLDRLRRDEVTGHSGQRQRQPPVGGCDSTGYGTPDALHQTGDARPWNSVAPWREALQRLPATS